MAGEGRASSLKEAAVVASGRLLRTGPGSEASVSGPGAQRITCGTGAFIIYKHFCRSNKD